MQGIFDVGIIQYWLIPLFIGLGLGHVLGGVSELSTGVKLTLMPAMSILGGYAIGTLLAFSISVDWNLAILSILSFLGGGILGMVINWRDPSHEYSKHAIVFAPEDEEDFDREIRKALGQDEESEAHKRDGH